MKKFSSSIAMLLLAIPLALAQQSRVYGDGGNWAQEVNGTLSAAKNLHIKVDIGSVRVVGGSQQGINYVVHSKAYVSSEDKARRQFDNYKISAYVRGDTAWIVGEWQGERPRKFSGDFVVNVPSAMDLVKVETEGGSVTGATISGRMEAQSGGGSIKLEDIGGVITAETGGGSIDVGSAGGDVNLRTGGGSIKVASAKGKISAESGGGSVMVVSGLQGAILETGGGNIQVERCNGHLRATTGGGSIDAGDIAGPAEFETGGGSIRLASAKGPVRAETGGGSIELNGVPSARAETGAGGIIAKFIASGERGDSQLETSAGDIVIYLSSQLNMTVRAAIEMANGHSIRSDFSEIRVISEGESYGPRTITAEGNVNGGGPVLKVRTTTGDIVIRRSN
ncbi:MAG TPA: hypothetical protein VH437_07750 [Terriglobales bacterium]